MTGTLNIGGGHWLAEAAARSYLRMLAAGCPRGITSSTRTEELQRAYWLNQGKPGWPAKADNPARSKHVWRPGDPNDKGARALDLPEPARGWVRAWGEPFGWVHDRVSNEPWHMEHESWRDVQATLVDRPVATPPAPPTAPALPPLPDPLTPATGGDDDDMLDRLNALYLARLGRTIDPSGFATFGTQLTLGQMSWAAVDTALRQSAEGQAFARLSTTEQDKRRARAKI